ncbi:acyltransferase family protein [Ferruginibacter profundus]
MTEQSINIKKPATRLLSLDALRGFDMFWIISGEGIFHGLANVVVTKHSLYRNPADWQIAATGDLNFWERIAVGISNQLHHTPWNGFTFYDIIFPLFIFIAGISMPFSFGKQIENAGANMAIAKKNIYRSLIKRTLILLFLGMVVNGLFKWQGYENTRMASVLGRIALSCFFAAIIYLNSSLRTRIIWFAGLLLLYWAAMVLIPVPGYGAGVLTPEGNLEAYIDRILLPGKLHRAVYDPEGLLSTIPAIGSAMLGVFTGQFLGHEKLTSIKKVLVLIATGIVLLLMGLLWDIVFPINKNMWTSAFVLYAGGWSVLLFAVFYYVIDVAGFKKWCMPFVWVGCNSILIYMAAHGVVNFESTSTFLFGGLYNKTPEMWHSALLWTGVALIQFAALYFLYKKKWFLKI